MVFSHRFVARLFSLLTTHWFASYHFFSTVPRTRFHKTKNGFSYCWSRPDSTRDFSTPWPEVENTVERCPSVNEDTARCLRIPAPCQRPEQPSMQKMLSPFTWPRASTVSATESQQSSPAVMELRQRPCGTFGHCARGRKQRCHTCPERTWFCCTTNIAPKELKATNSSPPSLQ